MNPIQKYLKFPLRVIPNPVLMKVRIISGSHQIGPMGEMLNGILNQVQHKLQHDSPLWCSENVSDKFSNLILPESNVQPPMTTYADCAESFKNCVIILGDWTIGIYLLFGACDLVLLQSGLVISAHPCSA